MTIIGTGNDTTEAGTTHSLTQPLNNKERWLFSLRMPRTYKPVLVSIDRVYKIQFNNTIQYITLITREACIFSNTAAAATTMSNPTQVLRDEEELEATLLPVATRLEGNQQYANAATATALPLDYFNYDTALAEEARQVHVAPALPERYDGTIVDEQDSQRLKLAQRSGLIAAEAEKVAIRKADLRGYAQGYHEQDRIQAANRNARERNRQGLQMKTDQQEQARLARCEAQREEEEFDLQIQQESNSNTKSNSSKKPTSGYAVGGGYQTSEYQVGSYDTNEYQVSQYKSVYD